MRFIAKITLAASFALMPFQASRALVAGSYNIRYDNPGDVEKGNSWQQRVPVIAGLIRFHEFDVLGTQEAFHHQLLDLQKLLPNYAYVGCGRNDGKEAGEHAAIFFRKDMFKLEDSGTFWLSQTPEKPGKGWDADLPRICTWAKLHKTEGGEVIFVFNTHFDHRGVQARLESARLIVTRIREIAKDEPVILTGDFNVDQNSESYRSLHDSGLLSDSFETAADRYALNGTANAFRPDSKTDSRIDHVFHTKQLKPVRYGVLTDTYRTPVPDSQESQSGNFPGEVKFRNFQTRLPSDHFPVLVEFE
ncbi:MAG: endonuclease/exonuclease/phosphatase family protein [Verrucomicrobiaceae bacterium]|nr:MAG: endonuclease/exonuclease/phosphatase family protein [Verrucomicrobiaceae bacterium]